MEGQKVLDGKTALVTGAGSGIGRACAIALADAGAAVALADRDRQGADAACADIRSAGGTAIPVDVDIGDLKSIDAMIDHVAAELGPVDNAGIARHGWLLEITEETWDLLQQVNARGTFFCMQRVARQMVERERPGRIVNISSIGGKGFRRTASAAYAASKGAVIAMTYVAAFQLSAHDITVNAICPGVVDTALLRGMLSARSSATGTPVEDLVRDLEQMVPLGRLNTPEDMAAMVVFLAGPGGRNITGQTFNIDGGMIMQ
jgi:NAD(P)-dependent dehydrogenase (short-subunit alcohol dehydrogenase family)